MPTKVCHMTSAHRNNDTRIFYKECVSLARAGYEVYLVANGESFDKQNVHVIGIGEPPNSRIKRMLFKAKSVYKAAVNINADIYHLHDPELLPYALKLKKRGKKVIFDSHEDYGLLISEKEWIPKAFRSIMASIYEVYEKYICRKIDGVVVCYHWTEERLREYCKNTKMILNYPILKENSEMTSVDYSKRAVSFAGGISVQWCHKEVLLALNKLSGIRYELAGKLVGQYGIDLTKMKEWSLVNYHGLIPMDKVFTDVYANSSIGMALLDYIPLCKGKVGNLSNTKFFEYMYMGLPLICTDFDLWKEIIIKENCGICVCPHDVDEIAEAINYLINNPEVARRMGQNGRRAIINKYNWGSEEKKLFELYFNILSC